MASASDRTVAVSCRGVTKAFGTGNARTLALRGIDLDVYFGQLTMMVGPSGCGKTTLLSVLAGTLDLTEGTIKALDFELHRISSGAKVRFRRNNVGRCS